MSDYPVRDAAEANTLRHLAARDFRAASMTVADYEAAQPVPRGIGIDWANYNPRRDIAMLGLIFNEVPGILKGIRPDALETVRLGAGMMALWGMGRPRGSWRPWFPLHYDIGTHLEGDVAARMYSFYASNRSSLDQYRSESVVRRVKVSACPGHCRECGEVSGSYSLDEVPELPHPDCTSEIGCRCIYIGKLA